jgi:hypothetical protein
LTRAWDKKRQEIKTEHTIFIHWNYSNARGARHCTSLSWQLLCKQQFAIARSKERGAWCCTSIVSGSCCAKRQSLVIARSKAWIFGYAHLLLCKKNLLSLDQRRWAFHILAAAVQKKHFASARSRVQGVRRCTSISWQLQHNSTGKC